MSNELLTMLEYLERERGISRDTLLQAMQEATSALAMISVSDDPAAQLAAADRAGARPTDGGRRQA